MLTIRLQRTGKKNQADFRIVLAEKEAPVAKKVVEILGSYNPRKKVFQAKEERLKYWLSQRVELSETMHNLLVTQKFVDAPKVKAFTIPKKPVAPTTPSADAATPPQAGGETASSAETPADVAEAIETMEAKVEATTVPEVVAEAPAPAEVAAPAEEKPAEPAAQ